MKRSLLLAAIGMALDADSPDPEIRKITEDSRQADADSLFVCIQGFSADGHAYAQRAYQSGCRSFLAEHSLSLPEDAAVYLINDTRKALALLACAFYAHPSHRLRVIGVTGTKGKTTVACLLREILLQNGISCGYIGTNGIHYGNVSLPTKNTTPDALTFQRTLHEMQIEGCSAAVAEVSSQALKQFRIDGTLLEACIFTNFSPDHIGEGEHADIREYFACKHRLFTDFGAQTVLYNADDPCSADMIADASAKARLACSLQANGNYTAKNISFLRSLNGLGLSFTLQTNEEEVACQLPMIGSVNVCNALLAVAAAHACFEISLPCAAAALKNAAVLGRSEVLALPSGALAVIDYAHNGESLRQMLQGLRAYQPRRLICLFGSVGDRTEIRRRELGDAAASLADFCILTSDNPGKESPLAILSDIAERFSGSSTPYVCIPDRAAAIRYGMNMAQQGDILLLAGKGHESYQLIQSQMVPFSEREILLGAT